MYINTTTLFMFICAVLIGLWVNAKYLRYTIQKLQYLARKIGELDRQMIEPVKIIKGLKDELLDELKEFENDN